MPVTTSGLPCRNSDLTGRRAGSGKAFYYASGDKSRRAWGPDRPSGEATGEPGNGSPERGEDRTKRGDHVRRADRTVAGRLLSGQAVQVRGRDGGSLRGQPGGEQ